MLDPVPAAVAIGLLGSVVVGPAVAYGLALVPQQRRRATEWLLILAAVALTVLADLVAEGPVGGSVIYVIAVLPGLVAFLAWRTLLASTFVSLAPLYIVIAVLTRGRATFAPELPFDRAVSLQPAWMLVYGSLYVFIVVMPLLVVRQRDLFLRALRAYIMVMLVAYAGFILYPTAAPRPDSVPESGFAAWSLRLAYSLDPPYNCFPSLHVAYSFVSALTCYRVHRGVGTAAAFWAALIGASTLYTKQHYVVDVIAGALAAFIAYALFLRTYPFEAVPEIDRRRAPVRALGVVVIFAVTVVAFWVIYQLEWLSS